MDLRKSLFPMLAVTLASCGGSGASAPKAAGPEPTATGAPKLEAAAAPKAAADGHVVSLYRGVRLLPGSYTTVDWGMASFGVSGRVPSLTLFDSANMSNYPPGFAPACWVQISVTLPGPTPFPPPVGSSAALAIPAPPVQGAQPGPWAVLFDNNPVGHWSIGKDQIVGTGPVSNRQASIVAGQTFRQLVQGGQASVIPGTSPTCQP